MPENERECIFLLRNERIMDKKTVSPYNFFEAEIVKFKGKDCVILEIKKSGLGYNKYKLWDIDSGDTIVTTKENVKKNDLETIGLAEELTESKNVEEVDTASFDIGIDNLVGFCEEVPVQQQQTKQRHSKLETTQLDSIAAANNERNTTYSTKWAVNLFKGLFFFIFFFIATYLTH